MARRRTAEVDTVARLNPRLDERQYQLRLKASLDFLYSEVTVQWRPFHGEGRARYAPIVDIAVGPFALRQRYEAEYTELLHATQGFIESLITRHNENVGLEGGVTNFRRIEHFNENARCFLCIEIEDSGSRKHCLGNLINASALGRIGLLVARNQKVFRTFVRQRAYLSFLAEVGKNTFKTDNTLIVTAEQFDECLAAELANSAAVRNRKAPVRLPNPRAVCEGGKDDLDESR